MTYKNIHNDDQLDPWFLVNLVCPVDKSKLFHQKNELICRKNHHKYPVYKNIPIMLANEEKPIFGNLFQRTLDIANGKINIEENLQTEKSVSIVDPYVQQIIGASNSYFYRHLKNKLPKYPIPTFPMKLTKGKLILDIGCNWGRWCLSAFKSGFSPVGLDPNLESILSAKRVAKQLGIQPRYLVADARCIPFQNDLFDYCYSYSVLQHFSKPDVNKVLSEIKCVLKPGGISQIQMLNKYGLRSLYVQSKRGFRKPQSIETRYWSPKELLNTFEKNIGFSKILLGSFFTQAQDTDSDIFTLEGKIIFKVSLILKIISNKIPFLKKYADNLFLISQKNT